MLTIEARKRRTSYEYANSMVNLGWVAGWLERTQDPQKIVVMQGSKREFGVPIDIRTGESMRPGYQDCSPIKVTVRVGGQFLKEQGERIAVLRALDIDNPTVLDMQPYERKRSRNADGDAPAPQSAESEAAPANSSLIKPKKHRVLLPEGMKAKLSSSANFFRIAGYIGGVAVEPGKMKDDGRPGEPCLVILLQQDEDPDNAIPIRFYNRLAEAIADKLLPGFPIIVNDGEIKMKVVYKEPEVEGGERTFVQYPYIKARVPKIASNDHILIQPKWAESLLKTHLAAKAKRTVARAAAGAGGKGGGGDDGNGDTPGASPANAIETALTPPAPAVAAAAAAKAKPKVNLADLAPE